MRRYDERTDMVFLQVVPEFFVIPAVRDGQASPCTSALPCVSTHHTSGGECATRVATPKLSLPQIKSILPGAIDSQIKSDLLVKDRRSPGSKKQAVFSNLNGKHIVAFSLR